MLQGMMAAVSSADVTPDAVNWTTLTGVSPKATSDLTITGISRDITLSVSDTGSAIVEYRIDSGSWTTYSAPFTVSDGETLGWRVDAGGSGTITVTNDTDGGATLDLFIYNLS